MLSPEIPDKKPFRIFLRDQEIYHYLTPPPLSGVIIFVIVQISRSGMRIIDTCIARFGGARGEGFVGKYGLDNR